MGVQGDEFRRALGAFATGITVITVDVGNSGEIHGMTANAFSSVSLNPPLVLVCVDQRARSHSLMQERQRFGINVLAEDQRQISDYFARSTETHQNPEEASARFDRTQHGTPVLHGTLAYLECRLTTAQVAGDHTIFIGEVEDVVVREGKPLLYFRGKYHQLHATE